MASCSTPGEDMEMSLIIFFCLLAGVHPVEAVIKVDGYVGRSAVIRCSYDRGYEGYSKYLCRGTCAHILGTDIPVRTKAGQTKAVNGRFSLHDDTTAGVFTVTITGLTAGDSGQYWCGVSRVIVKTDVYTKVGVRVLKASTPAPSSSSSPPFSPPSSNTSQSELVEKTTISDQQTTVERQEVPENSVVMVILCVLVLLVMVTVCVLVSALYYRQRRSKQTAVCNPSSLRNSNHVEEVSNYEMVEELGSILAARPSVSSLYCLAGAPHRPSVTSLCSTVRPVTQGSDQPTYCNSQEDTVIYSNDISPEKNYIPHDVVFQ
ncbi:uncharacterized protein LOC143123567 [Alosa pseudoharengus]|uniref:uncharacterized protein LOC143123567 n=1 Tax=Alosa pseudoharengus TaxID=34774 RepID=UPI003F894A8B